MYDYVFGVASSAERTRTSVADRTRSQLIEELGQAVEQMATTYAAEGRGRQYGASIVTAILMEADNESLRKIIDNLRAETARVQARQQQAALAGAAGAAGDMITLSHMSHRHMSHRKPAAHLTGA
jgi:hypothetical protein